MIKERIATKAPREEPARASAEALLISPAFLLAVAVLVLNDWVLKPALGNWWTGKLSDFAGLFAFAIFWSAWWPSRARWIVAMTAVAWLIWKSPLSGPLLDAWNALGVWPLRRVVDYSDWLALVALVPAYRLVCAPAVPRLPRPHTLVRHVSAVASAIVAIVAFTATSQAPPRYDVGPADTTIYTIPVARADVPTALKSLGLDATKYSTGRHAGVADTLRVEIRHPPERWVSVTIDVHESTPGHSTIRLLGYSVWGPESRSASIHRAFEAQVIEPLTSKFAPPP